jgi:hypothetical protein
MRVKLRKEAFLRAEKLRRKAARKNRAFRTAQRTRAYQHVTNKVLEDLDAAIKTPATVEITAEFKVQLAQEIIDRPTDLKVRKKVFERYAHAYGEQEQPGIPYSECSNATIAASFVFARAKMQEYDARYAAAGGSAANGAAAGGSAAGGAAAP